jgi:hypothetical protein
VIAGMATANTDGIALTGHAIGLFAGGALFAVDDDRRIAAFDWRTIARRFNLDEECPGR